MAYVHVRKSERLVHMETTALNRRVQGLSEQRHFGEPDIKKWKRLKSCA